MSEKKELFWSTILFILAILVLFFIFRACMLTPVVADNGTWKKVGKMWKIKIDNKPIKVGKDSEDTFIPNVNFPDSDFETKNLKIRIPDGMIDCEEPLIDGDTLVFKDDKMGYYWKPDSTNTKRLKFGLIFYEKPDGNLWAFPMEGYEDFDFYYQDENNMEPDSNRPDEVMESYAVYFKEYSFGETGKFCHLYRIKFIANNGDWIWGNIAILNGNYIISYPPSGIAFFNTAEYPITTNDTFGYDTIGGSTTAMQTVRIYASGKDAPAQNGTLDSIDIYSSNISATIDLKTSLYTDNAGTIDALVATEVETGNPGTWSASWKSLNAPAIAVTSGTTYWIAVCGSESNQVTLYYDSLAGTNRYWDDTVPYANSWNDPFTRSSSSGAKYSFRASYSPLVITPTLTPTPTETETQTQTLTPTLTLTETPTLTVTPTSTLTLTATITATPTTTCTEPSEYYRIGLNSNCDSSGHWEDTYVDDIQSNTNYGNATVMYVSSVNPPIQYTHIRIDLEDIYDYINITYAKLWVKVNNFQVGSSATMKLYVLNQDWVELEDTFNIYSTGNNWTNNNGGLDDLGNLIGEATWWKGDNWKQIEFNATGIALLKSSALPGYVDVNMFLYDTSNTCGIEIISSENLDATIRPYVEICYAPYATPTATQTMTPTLTQTLSPTLTLTQTPTLTQTISPTLTLTETPTLTITATPTITPTLTQTATLTVSPTLTQTVPPFYRRLHGYFYDYVEIEGMYDTNQIVGINRDYIELKGKLFTE